MYDYKGGRAPAGARWIRDGSVQVALYMRAVESLLRLSAVGGFYQPLTGEDLRARGVLDGDAGIEIECVRSDVLEHEQIRDLSRRRWRGRAGGRRGGPWRAAGAAADVRVPGRLHVPIDLPMRLWRPLSGARLCPRSLACQARHAPCVRASLAQRSP